MACLLCHKFFSIHYLFVSNFVLPDISAFFYVYCINIVFFFVSNSTDSILCFIFFDMIIISFCRISVYVFSVSIFWTKMPIKQRSTETSIYYMTILIKILQSIFRFFVRFPYAVVKDHHSKYRCKVGAGLEPAGHQTRFLCHTH